MKAPRWVRNPKNRLDFVAGFCDGILTALALTAGRLLSAGAPMQAELALRVAAAAAVSGMFVFFVAHYADLRGELVEAERQLNLTAHGQLARLRLGRAALREAAGGALIASTCSFAGALFPLMIGTVLPRPRWLTIAAALAALAVLGASLAKVVHGEMLRWVGGLLFAGVALAYVGMRLKIV